MTISLEQVRKELNDYETPDEKLLEIRDSLYTLAEIALDAYFESKKEV